jgi:hypothetical protein
MEAPSPPEAAKYIPAAAHFRGEAPLLNFRIDVNGHKLLRTKTLEALHRAALQPIEAEAGYVPAAHTIPPPPIVLIGHAASLTPY